MFYEIFVQLCQKNGESPTAVLKKLGIHKTNVTNWKNGIKPKLDKLQALADYFDVSVEELTGKTEISEKEKNITESDVKSYFFGEEGCTKEDWQDIIEFIRFKQAKQTHKEGE